MKKLLTLLFIISSYCAIGQVTLFPTLHTTNNAKTLEKYLGGLTSDVGLIDKVYADTTAANLNPYLKYYHGARIVVGDSTYFRSRDLQRWVLVTGSGGGGVGADQTWQQTLITGSTLTQTNNVTFPYGSDFNISSGNATVNSLSGLFLGWNTHQFYKGSLSGNYVSRNGIYENGDAFLRSSPFSATGYYQLSTNSSGGFYIFQSGTGVTNRGFRYSGRDTTLWTDSTMIDKAYLRAQFKDLVVLSPLDISYGGAGVPDTLSITGSVSASGRDSLAYYTFDGIPDSSAVVFRTLSGRHDTIKGVSVGGTSGLAGGSSATDSLLLKKIDWATPSSNVVYDTSKYVGFPNVVERGGVLYTSYYTSNGHVSLSPVVYKKSTDGGRSWSSEIQISATTHEALAMGVTSTGRLIYLTAKGANNVLYIHRTGENNETWTVTTQTKPLATNDAVVYGHIKQLPSGRLLCPYYKYTSGSEKAGFITSTDEGATWTYWYDVATNLNEMGFEVLDGTTDSDTRLITIARDATNYNAKNRQYNSDDGGVTWTLLGDVPVNGTPAYGYPADIYKDGDKLYVLFGTRIGTMSLQLFKTTFAIYDSLAAYGKPYYFYEAEANLKGAYNDFGYPAMFKNRGEIYCVLYDQFALEPPRILSEAARLLTVQLTGVGYGEFSRSGANSYNSIPYTKVALSVRADRVYDTEHFWEEDLGVSGLHKIVIPEDGFYNIYAEITFDTTVTTGTYRKMGVQLVNPGFPLDPSSEYPENPLTGLNAPEAITHLASAVVGADIGAPFNTLQCTRTFFAKKGYEVVLYTVHDAATTTITTNNAKLTIKAIH